MNPAQMMRNAQSEKTIIPAFNIPYLPMVEAVVKAIVDENSVGMIMVARLEWIKFKSESLEAVAEEYFKYHDDSHTMLHLDHVPVIDEDQQRVDYMPVFERAAAAGYQSIMIDGSRLPLDENILVTRQAAEFAHKNNMACEAELGAVAGHEKTGLDISYEELFRTRRGFTKLDEAARFARESEADWLSVAAGSIHGAVAESVRKQKKPEARLDIEHIANLSKATDGIPLVLHGGSGIHQEYILKAAENGIAKINIGTEIRQAYEFSMDETMNDVDAAKEAVYQKTRHIINSFLQISGLRDRIGG
jgi:fructose-bisphosphate aldolase class II